MSNCYYFSEELPCTGWLKRLPPGFLTNRIDLEYQTVDIAYEDDRIAIYVGPADPYIGGSAINVILDADMELVEFYTESLAPLPRPAGLAS